MIPSQTPQPSKYKYTLQTSGPKSGEGLPIEYLIQPGDTFNNILKTHVYNNKYTLTFNPEYQFHAAKIIKALNELENIDYIKSHNTLLLPDAYRLYASIRFAKDLNDDEIEKIAKSLLQPQK